MPHRRLNALINDTLSKVRLPRETVVSFAPEEWDETIVDLSDLEQLTFTQVDEHGKTHTVILSLEMATKLRIPLLQWLTANTPA